MSKIGGSGIAVQNTNVLCSPSFDWCMILPPVSIGLVLALHLILPVHENYRLKPPPYFGNFLTFLLLIYGIAAIGSIFSRWIRETGSLSKETGRSGLAFLSG
jgi:hypothetical protein